MSTARSRWFWVFIGPFALGLAVFVYVPMLWSIYLSFFNARNTVSPSPADFVGLSNYAYLLGDGQFRSSMLTFIAFAVFIVPVTFVCSLGLAVLLHRIRFLQAFFRSVFFLPTAVSYVIASMVWRLAFFHGARFGLANQLLGAAGGDPVNWVFGDQPWYWLVLVTLRLWLQVGFYMILFIAGLNRIPTDTYEAAAIDGASGWQTFRYVTFPQLRTTNLAVMMLLLIGAFQAFDEFWNVMSQLGTSYPPYARPPLVHLYLIALGGGSQDLGVGSAGTMILTSVIVCFGLAQNWLLSRGGDTS